MWFVQALDAADTTLNICVAYRLTGSLDPQRLCDAFTQVVGRHVILRTTYGVDAAGEPYQEFRDEGEIAWLEEDLTGPLETVAQREFGRPFDLTADPPLRVTLLRCGAEEFVLLLTVHHICWDDDCWAVFFGSSAQPTTASREPGRHRSSWPWRCCSPRSSPPTPTLTTGDARCSRCLNRHSCLARPPCTHRGRRGGAPTRCPLSCLAESRSSPDNVPRHRSWSCWRRSGR